MPRTSLARLRRARSAHYDRLSRLPNVVGTGIGVKRRNGERDGQSALIIFVDRKVPLEEISARRRIPRFVIQDGERISTDVVEINGIRPELGPAPYFLTDRATKGVVAALGRSGNDYFMVSCAHCLTGEDGDPLSVSPIAIWDSVTSAYVEAGQTVYAIRSPGFGVPGNFGFSDVGFALIAHPALIARARMAQPLSVLATPRVTMAVAAQGPHGPMHGAIDGVDVILLGRRTDYLILNEGAGSFPGCSGMMWRNSAGHAIGMHSYGAHFLPSGGSRYSLAMAARRIAGQLDLSLLDPG